MPHPTQFRSHRLRRRRSVNLGAAFLLLSLAAALPLPGQPMPAAPAGRVESGVPSFVVFGPETIGLSTLPTGIHSMPDGRILVTSDREIAFGDGVRWETYRAAEGQAPIYRDALVDDRGSIYFGLDGAIGRLEIGGDGLWRAAPALALPDQPGVRRQTLVAASRVGSDWYWYTGSGGIVCWRPGQPSRLLANSITIETIFKVGGEVYASDKSSGGLYCLSRGGERVMAIEHFTSELITAAVPLDDSTVLLGTYSSGVRRFDGRTFRPFGNAGPLNAGTRINDLCSAGDGFFAAAIDTVGIVFFDRTGKVVQVLDSRLDHRLARVEKLRYSNSGVLWALLNEGVARVEFPSRVSRFEPLISSGLSYAAPYRYRGDLWMLADGRALRGVYDEAGRLLRLDADEPPGRFVFTIASVDDTLFACTDVGIFIRDGAGWTPVAPGVVNARIGFAHTPGGALVYAARGEIGTLTKTADGYTLRRLPLPALSDNYNVTVDGRGVAWLELGNAHVARLDPHGAEPRLDVLGPEAGLRDGWVAIFEFEGAAHFQVPNRLLRFDDRAQRFVDDTALLARYPQLISASSRPRVDPSGHLWYAYHGRVWTLDLANPAATPELKPVPFTPIEFKFEADGVAWMLGNRRLERYDSRVPDQADLKPRVIVTSLHFPNSNRRIFDPGAVTSIPYADNTIVFRFAAPANPFAAPITFQVQLEGVSDQWVTTGSTGEAVFNRLKEGRYTFRVRAVTNSGVTSDEARVAFTIQPPWFRAPAAWVAYVLMGATVVFVGIWYPSFRHRRENARLEREVAKRTEELHRTNQQLARQIQETMRKSGELATSEERYRTLSAELERRVEEREKQLAATYKELLATSRLAGMAEVATGVLHNVGNVLNSLNVSSNLLAKTVRQSKAESLAKLAALLDERAGDLGEFLTRDPKGRLVPDLLRKLAEAAVADRDWLQQEVASMQKNIDHIKEIVVMQQSYATVAGVIEKLEPQALCEDALRMNSGALSRHDVRVVREFLAVPPIAAEKGKILQILINLIRNAKYACDDGQAYNAGEKTITLRLEPAPGERVRFIVRDNGIGIPAENLTRIFAHGFTTRSYGHGFGLHSSALAAKDMKGSLTVHSEGLGHGATFILELPVAPTVPESAASEPIAEPTLA